MVAKRGLYANINAKRKAGTSKSKAKSTIAPKAYANMKAGFPNSKKNKKVGY
jgi:hypothetical protein